MATSPIGGRGDTRRRSPVMADVARLAGVSHQTVSRVLNDHPSVSRETRERVGTAIAQLGYRRNTAARALVTRQSMTVGVVSVDTSHYGPANTLFGVEQAARGAGYTVTLATLRRVDRPHLRAALDHLMSANVDGIVLIAPVVAAVEATQGLALDVPFVVLEGGDATGHPSVMVDQRHGARLATRHLLDLGHRSVLHLRGPRGWPEADERVRGWQEELSEHAAVALPVLLGDWTPASGYLAGQQLAGQQLAGQQLAGRADVTAVFVANDQMALGVLRALHEAGIDVPGRMSVVGFDDIPEAGYFIPPLTTVRQDFAEVGRRAMAQLVSLIHRAAGREGEPVTRPEAEPSNGADAVRPELVVRASSGPPAALSPGLTSPAARS